MGGRRLVRRRVTVACAVAMSMLLAVVGWSLHPQGNIARALPSAVAIGAVWLTLTWAFIGRPAAAVVLGSLGALSAAAVLVYVVAVEPIPYAECGTLIEELS